MADAVVGSLNREVQQKLAAKYSTEVEQLLRDWFAELLPGRASAFRNQSTPFQQLIKDGVALCEVINIVAPGTIKKINNSQLAFKQMENISQYLEGCSKIGVTSANFQTVDLFESKNMSIVQQNIHLVYMKQKGLLNKIVTLEVTEARSNAGSRRRPLSTENSPLPSSAIAVSPGLDGTFQASPSIAVPTTSLGLSGSKGSQRPRSNNDVDFNQAVPGLSSSIWLKEEFKYSPELEAVARGWIEEVIGVKLPQDATLHAILKSGVILCKLANAIKPNSIPKIHESPLAFKQMENIDGYLQACRSLGLQPTNIFNTIDLHENKGMSLVLNNIVALGNLISRMSWWTGPKIRDTSKIKTLYSQALVQGNEALDLEDSGEAFDDLPEDQKTLVAWANYHILTFSHSPGGSSEPLLLQNLSKDVRSGLKLICLLQAVTRSTQIGSYEQRPRTLWQCMQNASLILRYLSATTFSRYDGCTAYDIVTGNSPAVIRLVSYVREKFDVDYMFNKLVYGEAVAAQQAASKFAIAAQEQLESESLESTSSAVAEPAEQSMFNIIPMEEIFATSDLSTEPDEDDGELRWEDEPKAETPVLIKPPVLADAASSGTTVAEPVPETIDVTSVLNRVKSIEEKILQAVITAPEQVAEESTPKKPAAPHKGTPDPVSSPATGGSRAGSSRKASAVAETLIKQLEGLGVSSAHDSKTSTPSGHSKQPSISDPISQRHSKQSSISESSPQRHSKQASVSDPAERPALPEISVPQQQERHVPAAQHGDYNKAAPEKPSVTTAGRQGAEHHEPLGARVESPRAQHVPKVFPLPRDPSTKEVAATAPPGLDTKIPPIRLGSKHSTPVASPISPKMRKPLVSFTSSGEILPPIKVEDSKLLEAQNRIRQHVAGEVLSTERSYVQSLSTLHEKFVVPLRTSGLFQAEEIFYLVANVEEILSLHKRLLGLIESRLKNWTEATVLSDIFLDNMEIFKKYDPYMTNYSRSSTYLTYYSKQKPELKKLIQAFDASQASTTQLWLDSFMIMPVQRIPRYILLLKDLRKYTSDKSPDKERLNNAVSQMETTLSAINGRIPKALVSDLDRVQKMLNSIDGPIYEYLNPNYKIISQLPLEKVKIKKVAKSQALAIRKETKHALVLTTGSIFVVRVYQQKKDDDNKLPYKLLWGSALSDMKDITYFQSKRKIAVSSGGIAARFKFKGEGAAQFMEVIRQK